jgi:hypothetical protein
MSCGACIWLHRTTPTTHESVEFLRSMRFCALIPRSCWIAVTVVELQRLLNSPMINQHCAFKMQVYSSQKRLGRWFWVAENINSTVFSTSQYNATNSQLKKSTPARLSYALRTRAWKSQHVRSYKHFEWVSRPLWSTPNLWNSTQIWKLLVLKVESKLQRLIWAPPRPSLKTRNFIKTGANFERVIRWPCANWWPSTC